MSAQSSISGSLCALCFVIITIITAFLPLPIARFPPITQHHHPPTPRNILSTSTNSEYHYSLFHYQKESPYSPCHAPSSSLPIHPRYASQATVTAFRPFTTYLDVPNPSRHRCIYYDCFEYLRITCLFVHHPYPPLTHSIIYIPLR